MSVTVKHFNETGNENKMFTIFCYNYLTCSIQFSDDVFGVSYCFLPPDIDLWMFVKIVELKPSLNASSFQKS